jgi:hypothetical protein
MSYTIVFEKNDLDAFYLRMRNYFKSLPTDYESIVGQNAKKNRCPVSKHRARDRGENIVTMSDPSFSAILVQLTVLTGISKSYIRKHMVCMTVDICDRFTVTEPSGEVSNIIRKMEILQSDGYGELFTMIVNDDTTSLDEFKNYLERRRLIVDPVHEAVVEELKNAIVIPVANPNANARAKANANAKSKTATALDKILIQNIFSVNGRPTLVGNTHFETAKKEAFFEYVRSKIPSLKDINDGIIVETFLSKYINPSECENEKDLYAGYTFATSTLKDIGFWVKLRPSAGKCLTIEGMFLEMLSSQGQPSWMADVDEKLVKPLLNHIVDYHNKDDVTRGEFIDQIAQFLDLVYIEKALGAKANANAKANAKAKANANANAAKKKSYLLKQLKPEELKPEELTENFKNIGIKLIKWIVDEWKQQAEVESIQAIVEKTRPQFFYLLALLGYLLLSDDISSFDETGTHFKKSYICLAKFQTYRDQLKNLYGKPLDDTLEKLNCQVGENQTSLQTILTELGSTCIHGSGNRLMGIYIAQGTKMQGVPLCPMFFKIPPILSSKLTGKWVYLTCIKYEWDVHENPYNINYVIMAYRPNGSASYVARINVRGYKDNGIGVLDLESSPSYEVTPYKYEIPDHGIIAAHLRLNTKDLLHLVRIPYLFHKDRIDTFQTYTNYALHTLNLNFAMTTAIGDPLREHLPKIYQTWDTKNKPSVMDYIELDEKEVSAELFYAFQNDTTLLNVIGNPEKSISANDNINTLMIENLLDLEYIKNTEGKAIVRDMTTQQDITRVYQQASLLAKMIRPEKTFQHVTLFGTTPSIKRIKNLLSIIQTFAARMGISFNAWTTVFKLAAQNCFEHNDQVIPISDIASHVKKLEPLANAGADEKREAVRLVLVAMANISISNVDQVLDELCKLYSTKLVEDTITFDNDKYTVKLELLIKQLRTAMALTATMTTHLSLDGEMFDLDYLTYLEYDDVDFEFDLMLMKDSNAADLTRESAFQFSSAFYRLMYTAVASISRESRMPSTLHLHIGETVKDFFLLQELNTKIANQSDRKTACAEFLKDKMQYYRENKDLTVETMLADNQDLHPLVIDYVTRQHVWSEQVTRVLKIIPAFDNFIDNVVLSSKSLKDIYIDYTSQLSDSVSHDTHVITYNYCWYDHAPAPQQQGARNVNANARYAAFLDGLDDDVFDELYADYDDANEQRGQPDAGGQAWGGGRKTRQTRRRSPSPKTKPKKLSKSAKKKAMTKKTK